MGRRGHRERARRINTITGKMKLVSAIIDWEINTEQINEEEVYYYELKALLPDSTPSVDDYVIPIGKYKGRNLVEIFALDKNYCEWMADNIDKEPLRTLVRKLVYGEE